MKFKLLVKLAELLLGKVYSDEVPRADMYMPLWLLAFSLGLGLLAIGAGVYAAIALSWIAGLIALAAALLGGAALLCWKNQSIVMLSEDVFVYTTFLGNKKQYRFDEIRGLRKNNDSMTLLVGNGKVHIESTAILTPRLVERIDIELEKR